MLLGNLGLMVCITDHYTVPGELSCSHGREYEYVFWDVAPCNVVEIYRRFRGTCCLHHQVTSEDSLLHKTVPIASNICPPSTVILPTGGSLLIVVLNETGKLS
jgi:hypothetical protein